MATGGLIQLNKSMRCTQKKGMRKEFCVLKDRRRHCQQYKEQAADGDFTMQIHCM
jgi:hypothetical protein